MIQGIIVIGIILGIVLLYLIPTYQQQFTLYKIHQRIISAKDCGQNQIEVVVNMKGFWYNDIIEELQQSYRLENVRSYMLIGHKYQIHF